MTIQTFIAIGENDPINRIDELLPWNFNENRLKKAA